MLRNRQAEVVVVDHGLAQRRQSVGDRKPFSRDQLVADARREAGRAYLILGGEPALDFVAHTKANSDQRDKSQREQRE